MGWLQINETKAQTSVFSSLMISVKEDLVIIAGANLSDDDGNNVRLCVIHTWKKVLDVAIDRGRGSSTVGGVERPPPTYEVRSGVWHKIDERA